MSNLNLFGGCEFCAQVNRDYTLRNRILYQSERLTVWPSLGPLGFAHILIIPNIHRTAFVDLDSGEQQEFNALYNAFSTHCNLHGFRTLAGEHGNQPLPDSTPVIDRDIFAPTCVAHAHIHLIGLPVDYHDLLPAYRNELGEPTRTVNRLELFQSGVVQGIEYQLSGGEEGPWNLWEQPKRPLSQLVRRVAATALGNPERYNWRGHPHLNQVEAIARTLLPAFLSLPLNKVSTWPEQQSVYDLGRQHD